MIWLFDDWLSNDCDRGHKAPHHYCQDFALEY